MFVSPLEQETGWTRAQTSLGFSLALLVVTLVAGLASTAFIPLATFLLERLGWRSSVALLSGVVALCAVPLWLFVRHRPADLGLHPDGIALEHSSPTLKPDLSLKTVRRQSAFWWLTLAFALNTASTVALAAHLVPLLLERSLSPALSALAAGAVGLMSLLGRVLSTPSAAQFSLNRSSRLVFAVQGLALLSLLALPLSWSLWPFVLLMGASNGAATLSKAGLIAELYGSRNYGAVSGLMFLWMGLTTTASPLLVGVRHTVLGGYTPVLWGLAASSLLALLALARAEQVRVSAFSSALEGNS